MIRGSRQERPKEVNAALLEFLRGCKTAKRQRNRWCLLFRPPRRAITRSSRADRFEKLDAADPEKRHGYAEQISRAEVQAEALRTAQPGGRLDATKTANEALAKFAKLPSKRRLDTRHRSSTNGTPASRSSDGAGVKAARRSRIDVLMRRALVEMPVAVTPLATLGNWPVLSISRRE
jgi:hypothetical protein